MPIKYVKKRVKASVKKELPVEQQCPTVSQVVVVIVRYLQAVKTVVTCKGIKMKQVCHNCPRFHSCLHYLEMYDAWRGLEKIVVSTEHITKEEFSRQTFC